MEIPFGTYLSLSSVMFLEFAVWGAWAPILAARLLGPLKMTGKQTAWVYATLPMACILSPLAAGQLADRWLHTEYILAACHLLGAILLFVSVRQRTFRGMFMVMLGYSLCYAATLPLVNAVLFAHVADPGSQSWVFIWAPVAWALVGYALTGWRLIRKREGDGSDGLMFAGILSVLMALACLFLPATPPSGKGGFPILDALGMLRQPDFLVFILASMVIAGLIQFYFLGSARFMTDRGISAKAVPAAMAIAQVAQAVATILVLNTVLGALGFRATLTVGAACWVLLYAAYVIGRPRSIIVGAQALHGLAYVLFMIVGQVFANQVAPEAIRSSMQALVFAATVGIGLFFGSHLAGMVLDRFNLEGKFQWTKIWMVPLTIMIAGTLLLAAAFRGELPAEGKPLPSPQNAGTQDVTLNSGVLRLGENGHPYQLDLAVG
jgi:nucleoside transporter